MSQESKLEKIIEMSEEILQFQKREIDYQQISDNLLELVEAKFVIFNLFDRTGEFYTTIAISGPKGLVKKASKAFGIKLDGKAWPTDFVRLEEQKDLKIVRYKTLVQLAENTLPRQAIKLIENIFSLGEAIVIKIIKHGIMLGDFTIIMAKGEAFDNEKIAELYTRQIGILISKKSSDDELAMKVKELEDSEKNLRSLFDSVDDVFLVVDKFGRIIHSNKATEKKLGYTEEEIVK